MGGRCWIGLIHLTHCCSERIIMLAGLSQVLADFGVVRGVFIPGRMISERMHMPKRLLTET
jgi:hypothetical protein